MKSPLKRFLGGNKEKGCQGRQQTAAGKLHEFVQAEQDMIDMRDWWEGLLAAAATAANCAHELSEALGDLGTCLLQKVGMNDDEEIGRVLLKLGKEQFAIQKRVHDYRGHVIQTITKPSDSLLKELRTVEEMKRQCDERRFLLDHMIAANKEKRKSRNSNHEHYSSQQLRLAQEAYEQAVNEFAFRLKSLKKGQCQSLLTQVVRHHSAQLNLFRKGSETLESLELDVQRIAAQQHIERGFIELEDNGTEEYDSGFDSNDDSELSFDYGQTENSEETVSKPKPTAEEILIPSRSASLPFNDGNRFVSQSAPISSDRKFDITEKLKELQASLTKKTQTYVLPTPTNSGSLKPARLDAAIPVLGKKTGRETRLWHLSSLETRNTTKISTASYLSDTALKDSILKENNLDTKTTGMSPGDVQFNSQLHFSSKVTRHAFSGPLTGTAWSGKLQYSTPSSEYTGNFIETVQVPRQHASKSPRVSPRASPPIVFSPKISELHALPRPPLKPVNSSNIIHHSGHSAPLSMTRRGPEGFGAGKLSVTSKPSPLPMPPGVMVRSFSSPSSSQRMSPTVGARLSEVQTRNMFEDVASPPLSPMALIKSPPAQ